METLIQFHAWCMYRPFHALVNPGDTYIEKCRKFLVACMLIMTPLSLSVSIPFILQAKNEGLSAGVVVGALTAIIGIPILGIVPWLWIFHRRTWSERAVNIWLFAFNTIMHIFMLCISNSNFVGIYFISGGIDVLCLPTHLGKHVLYTLLGFFILKVNVNLYDNQFVSVELRIPGSMKPTPMADAVFSFVAISFFLFLILGLYSVLNEYRLATKSATNSVVLCYAVSEKMLMYDVKSAHELLNESNDVDPHLRSALRKLVKNLELFRPHLPEYVWEIVRARVEQMSSSSSNSTSAVAPSKGSINSKMQEESPCITVQHAMDHMLHSASSSIRSESSSTVTGGAARAMVLVPPMLTAGSELEFLGPERVENASYCIIDFTRRMNVADLVYDSPPVVGGVAGGSDFVQSMARPAAVRKMVNWAHAHILRSRGTLHTFIADTIVATWCFQGPSPKPALFLTHMYHKFNAEDSNSGIRIAGSLTSGAAVTYMAGDRRQAYIMHFEGRAVAHAIHRIARENDAALLNETSFMSCHPQVVCRWVDVLPSTYSARSRSATTASTLPPVKVFEIVRDRSDRLLAALDDEDEETDPDSRSDQGGGDHRAGVDTDDDTSVLMDAVSVSLEECIRGHYADAMRYLNYDTTYLKKLTSSTMIDRLIKKVNYATTNRVPGEEFANIVM